MSKNIVPLKVIPPGSEMTITVNTDLYVRLQQLLIEGLPWKDENHFKEVLLGIQKEVPKDGLGYHCHTITYLVQAIEQAAKDKGIIQEKKFDTELMKVVD